MPNFNVFDYRKCFPLFNDQIGLRNKLVELLSTFIISKYFNPVEINFYFKVAWNGLTSNLYDGYCLQGEPINPDGTFTFVGFFPKKNLQ